MKTPMGVNTFGNAFNISDIQQRPDDGNFPSLCLINIIFAFVFGMSFS